MSSALEAWKKRADDAAALQKEARNKQAVVTPNTSKQERLNSWEQRVEQVKSAYARPTDVVKRSYYRNEDGSLTAAEDMVDPRTKRNALEKQQETAALRQREREKAEFTKTAQELNRLNRSGGAKNLELQKELKEKKDDLQGDTSTRFGKGLQSIGLGTYASVEYLGESAKQMHKNQQAYEESDLQQRIAEAYSNLNLAERQYGWNSPEYKAAQNAYNAVTAELNAFKTAPERAVDMDSRAAQFMGGVQQLQEEALEGTSGVGRFLGEAALSIGSNLAKLPLNAVLPGASLALMGAEAAANKAYELGQRGVSAGEALTRGVVSGGIEALTEKIPLDNLMDIIKSGSKAGLMTLVKQAATEGGEEGVAYLLNLLADKAAGDQEAQFELNEFAKSIGMGALSGGILGGGATLLNRAGNVTAANDPAELAVQMLLRGEEISGKQAKRIMESDSAIAALQEAAGVTINRNAPASQVKAQIRSVGRDRAANTGAPVQTPRQAEMPVQPAGAVLEEAAMEMAEEQTRKETNVLKVLANQPAMTYTETRQNTEGGVNGGEEVYLREGSQWNDRADPGREVPRMEEGAGRDPGGQDPRFRPKDGGAAGLRVEKQVSTAALGIGGGASNDGVYVVSGGDTEATAKARRLAKERGLRLTLFTGGNLHINGEECRAYITGDRVFVRADHSDFDADQLIRHEAGHDQIAKGEIDLKAAIENVRTRLGDEGSVKRAVQTYASAFAGADMTVDEALEEIICDSLGDMNVFSGTEVEAEFSEVLDEARAAAGESRVESKTGPPVEGKASRDSDNRSRALRKGEMVNKFHKAVNWPAYYEKLNDPKYNPDKYDDGDIAYMSLGGQVLAMEMQTNGEFAVVSVRKGNGYGQNARNRKSPVGSDGRTGVSRSGEGYRDVRNRHLGDTAENSNGNRTDSAGGRIPQTAGQKPSADYSDAVKEDLAALGVEEVKGTVGKASRDAKREDVLRAVEQLLQEYGAIEPGENPFRSVQVPKQTGEGKNVSKTVRTILEAEATPDEMIPDVEALVAEGKLSYNPYSDAAAVSDAEKTIADIGWEKSLEKWKTDNKDGVVNKAHTVMGWVLYNNAAKSGKTDVALDVLQEMVGSQRNAAQALQATRVLKALSPDAQLYGVQRSVANLQHELEKRYKNKAPKLKVDPELAKKFLNAKGDEAQAEAMRELYRDIGFQMPATVRDMWDAWRYLAMLGNTRTHIRNILGNAVFVPVVAAKNVTATAVEHIVQKASGGNIQRTKSMVGGVAIYNVFNKDRPLYIGGKTTKALLKAAWDDYANVADLVSGGGKYSELKQSNKYIEEGRKIFKNKWLEKARKGNSAALEVEDIWFSQSHYTTALASYCKANNIPAQHIARGGEQIEKARAHAIVEAQKATYKDINQLSESMGKLGKAARISDNSIAKGFGLLMEGVLPFRKTPANILARAVEYSPIGLAKSLTIDLAKVRNAKTEDKPMLAAKAVDNFAAGFVGTALVAAGWVLAKLGLVRGRGEDDEGERKFREMQGHQAYSLELGDGTSITLDWLAPEALPFFIGVNLYEALNEDKQEISTEMIFKALANIGAPMLEMSCLQSLNDVFEAGNDADSTAGLSVVVSAATSYFTSGIPTLGGQLERIFQNERMFTYTDKNDRWIPTDLQYTIGSATSRIPILDYNQVPYIDAWGRTKKTPNRAENAFNNLINPAYVSKIETTNMEEELLRLYKSDANKENSILPSSKKKKVGRGDSEINFTAEQYIQYNTERGRTAYDLLTDLVDDKLYEKATDKQRIAAVEQAYDYASQVSRKHIQSEWNEMDTWIVRAMEADKVGLTESDVLLYRLALQMANEDGNNSYNQEEAQRAVEMLEGLTKQQKSYLWETTSKQWVGSKNNPYK